MHHIISVHVVISIVNIVLKPALCEKPAVLQEAGGRVRYSWLNDDIGRIPLVWLVIITLYAFVRQISPKQSGYFGKGMHLP